MDETNASRAATKPSTDDKRVLASTIVGTSIRSPTEGRIGEPGLMNVGHKSRVGLVTPGTRSALADIEARILAERGRVSLLYQVLLNSAPIARGWERMLTAVRNQTGVPAALRELIILRVAVLNEAPFEFQAHAPIARREGVNEQKIAAVAEIAIAKIFDPEERLVLELTDSMTRDIVVPDDLVLKLKQRYDDERLVELVATVAAYNMVSRFLVALHIEH